MGPCACAGASEPPLCSSLVRFLVFAVGLCAEVLLVRFLFLRMVWFRLCVDFGRDSSGTTFRLGLVDSSEHLNSSLPQGDGTSNGPSYVNLSSVLLVV